MLLSEQLLPNLLKRWKLSSIKLISKRIHVRGLSLNRQQSLKVVIVGQNSANSWERWTRRKRITACETAQHGVACVSCSCRFRPTATSFELRYRSCTSTHLRVIFMEFNFQFFFPVNLEMILQNVTSRKNSDVQMQNSNLKFGIMSISYM